jgi:catechol 2,3-dioxygenase-like lactoylglutathione lyase family enzyme
MANGVSSAEDSGAGSVRTVEPGTIDMGLEVVTLAVADIERAKAFYEGLGWRLDADLVIGEGQRVVQFTPTHSACSIHFGEGLTAAAPGSADRLILAVGDIEAARDDLIARGVEVGEVTGPEDPDQERSYFTTAEFSDPDGNGWVLQEITTRLPGREWED